MHTHPCAYCQALVHHPLHKTCGAKECRRLSRNDRARQYREALQRQGRSLDEYRVKVEHTCLNCGATFHAAHKRKCCSTQCGSQYANRNTVKRYYNRKRWREAKRKLDRAAKGTVGGAAYADTRCLACNRRFLVKWWGRSTLRYCSDECKEVLRLQDKRIGKDVRRARKRNAYVADVHRQKIYERDRYRCHLCGKKVKTTVTVPHHLAATIDHMIPLAAGGTHEPANCATAHYICNVRKSNRGGGEQLALIG